MKHLKTFEGFFDFLKKKKPFVDEDGEYLIERIKHSFDVENLRCFKDPNIFYHKSCPCSYIYEFIDGSIESSYIIIQPIITAGINFVCIIDGVVQKYQKSIIVEVYKFFESSEIYYSTSHTEKFISFSEILKMNIDYYNEEEPDEEEPDNE